MPVKISMLKTLSFAFLLVFLQGCVTAPPVVTGKHQSSLGLKATAQLLDAQARKCWTRPVDPIRFGVKIDSKVTVNDTVVISAFSINWGSGIAPKPFAIINIIGDAHSSIVEVWEGEVGCSPIFSCRKLDLSDHVIKWISGDIQCFEFPGSLMNL